MTVSTTNDSKINYYYVVRPTYSIKIYECAVQRWAHYYLPDIHGSDEVVVSVNQSVDAHCRWLEVRLECFHTLCESQSAKALANILRNAVRVMASWNEQTGRKA